MTTTKLECPNCGHHVANIASPGRGQVGTETLEKVRGFARSLTGRGRVDPTVLLSMFADATGTSVTPRALGLALRELGYQRVASQGRRYWVF